MGSGGGGGGGGISLLHRYTIIDGSVRHDDVYIPYPIALAS